MVDPQIESILMTPICTHSLFARSLVFKSDASLTMKKTTSGEMSLICDGVETKVPAGCEVRISKADSSAQFIRIKTDTFMDVLKTKLENGGAVT